MKTLKLKYLTKLAQEVLDTEYAEVCRPSYYDQNKPNAKFAVTWARLDSDRQPLIGVRWFEQQANTKKNIYEYLMFIKTKVEA